MDISVNSASARVNTRSTKSPAILNQSLTKSKHSENENRIVNVNLVEVGGNDPE